jgi:hypothetical protein
MRIVVDERWSSCPNVPAGSWSEALLQPVTRGRLAAVAAVQSKATFQFRDAGIGRRQLPFQRHNLLVLQGALREQQLNLLNEPLDVGGSLHPTLESDSPLRHQLLHATRVNSPHCPPDRAGISRIGHNQSGYLHGYLGSYQKVNKSFELPDAGD